MKLVICDLDNTLLDTLTKLEELRPNFKQETQRSYDLKKEELEPFIDASIYKDVAFNDEVLLAIMGYADKGYRIRFITRTLSAEARLIKSVLVDDLNTRLKPLHKFEIFTFDEYIESMISHVEDYTHLYSEIVLIDDAPERLDRYMTNMYHLDNVKLYIVEYVYNRQYLKHSKIKSFQPNKSIRTKFLIDYMLPREDSDTLYAKRLREYRWNQHFSLDTIKELERRVTSQLREEKRVREMGKLVK